MSAEIPQNRTVVETSLSPKTDYLGTLQSVCSVVQHHEENQPSCQLPQMSESEPGFSSQSVNQETFEEQQRSEIGRATCQPAQHIMPQRSPQENPGQNEKIILQLQVKQLQRVLQEQNALLSLISPGQILSPTFLAHWQVQTPPSFSDAIRPKPAGSLNAFEESSTKATCSGEVENESEALATNNTNDVAPSAELRHLSPIKEESSEPAQEDCPLSPFGSRQSLPPNPEERPIRPGLREEQKTFEDFVEEHLKTDQTILQHEHQTNTQIRGAEKKNFLRKGEGAFRISKGKDCSQGLQRRCSVSPQMLNMKFSQQMVCPTEFHQKEMPNMSSPGLKGVGNLSDQRSGLEDYLKKPVSLQDDDLSSNNKGKFKALTANNNAISLKSKHSVGVVRNYGKTNGSKSSGSALAQSRKSVGFKKMNDHIVKIAEKKCLTTNYSQSGYTSKEVSLTDEVMESLALSDSRDSTTSEDGPNSQSQRPLPLYLSRHIDHKDQSLDLSDGDYASDAPSETRFSEEHRTSTPTSSSSSFSSSSELKSLQGSMANCSKKTEERGTDSDFRQPSAPEPLTKMLPKVKVTPEDTTHVMGLEQPHTPIREEMGEHGFNGEDGCRPLLRLKKELHEPQDLRQQISSLKQKLMVRESHWSQAHSLLQSRVEALTRENQELHSRLNVNKRSHQSAGSSALQPGSYNTFEKRREEPQRTHHVRSATPAFNKPSIHRTQQDNSNGCSFTKANRLTECTDNSLRKNSALSIDSPLNNAMITQGGKGSLFYHHTDCNDTQMASQARKDKVQEETRYSDGRVERLFWSGCRVITFRNGTKKEIGVDKSVTVTFFNGDVKRTLADGTVIYYHCDAQTTHSTYPSGLEVVQFPNNQREKHHPDGTREISFPDGTVKILHSDGREESIFPDGTVVKISQHGEKMVEFANGQREIHTSQYKRRMYPDGTVKTVYTNGRQETKFSSGRVCIKNNEGIIIMDKK
ncbi:centromere protein J-like [Sinocyclocheilus anshuiensis]|uniref:centromere protein J-like n=1 Tax=Sinocyclocheilus anshuiensis TaxID=1608454 RepID=UPI0007B807EC|nr:PREDICTED: centromere protein J-like [Sinocyclocheilus anshuiensis]